MRIEFWNNAERIGRNETEIETVWNLLFGFQGYAFCRAHSTAYGVEAFQAAHLKRYHPAEFLAAVLTNEKGFYSPLAYTLEAWRLGIGFLSPDVNASRDGFYPEYCEGEALLRVPIWKVKDVTDKVIEQIRVERHRHSFDSLTDFYNRVVPTKAEAQNLIRAGAFDGFLPQTDPARCRCAAPKASIKGLSQSDDPTSSHSPWPDCSLGKFSGGHFCGQIQMQSSSSVFQPYEFGRTNCGQFEA